MTGGRPLASAKATPLSLVAETHDMGLRRSADRIDLRRRLTACAAHRSLTGVIVAYLDGGQDSVALPTRDERPVRQGHWSDPSLIRTRERILLRAEH